MTKEIVNIFVCHENWKSDKKQCLETAYNALMAKVKELNESLPWRDSFEIRLPSWEKTPNAILQNRETLLKDADKAHAVIVLVEGNITPAAKEWYAEKAKILEETDEERRVPIHVFWDISEDSSRKNFEEFCNENPQKGNYIRTYRHDEELNEELDKLLNPLASRWYSRIENHKPLPTMEGNRLEEEERKKKEAEEKEKKEKEARHRKLCKAFCIFFGAIAFFAFVCFAFYKHWPQYQMDHVRASMNERITRVESLMSQEEFDQARDTLNILSQECRDDWTDEKGKIDSLLKILSSPAAEDASEPNPPHPQEISSVGGMVLPGNGGNPNYPTTNVFLESGYSIESVDIDHDFLTMITSQIESKSNLRQYPGKEVRWTVRLSKTKYERGVVTEDYYIDLSVSAEIIDNIKGELAQLPLFKRECVMSSISYEDAFKEAADETLAGQIADSIINSINYEK